MTKEVLATNIFAASENFHVTECYSNVTKVIYTKAATPVQFNIPTNTLTELEDLLSEYRRARNEYLNHINSLSEV